MKPPRGLSAGEAALWRRVAETVTPLVPPRNGEVAARSADGGDSPPTPPSAKSRQAASPLHHASRGPPPRAGEELDHRTLDGTWDRRLAQGLVAPDAQIDLHGLGLDAAYARLMASLAQATLIGSRVVLVIAGKSRPHGDHGFSDHGQRANRRGAIRAKLLDWLAASPHASRIAAIRPAHQRHGGAGAVYVVLRRPR